MGDISRTGARRIGARVARLRSERGMSQTEFGKFAGVSAMAVSRWERGEVTPPAEACIAMAKCAGRGGDAWFFLGRAGLSRKDAAAALRRK